MTSPDATGADLTPSDVTTRDFLARGSHPVSGYVYKGAFYAPIVVERQVVAYVAIRNGTVVGRRRLR